MYDMRKVQRRFECRMRGDLVKTNRRLERLAETAALKESSDQSLGGGGSQNHEIIVERGGGWKCGWRCGKGLLIFKVSTVAEQSSEQQRRVVGSLWGKSLNE